LVADGAGKGRVCGWFWDGEVLVVMVGEFGGRGGRYLVRFERLCVFAFSGGK